MSRACNICGCDISEHGNDKRAAVCDGCEQWARETAGHEYDRVSSAYYLAANGHMYLDATKGCRMYLAVCHTL